MKRYMNIFLCAGLLMGVPSMRAEDEQPKSWLAQTGETALKTTDILCDYRVIIPIIGAANFMGYHVNISQLIGTFQYANAVRFFVGFMTQNSARTNSAMQSGIVAVLMSLARKDCWVSTFQDGLQSAAGLGLFVHNPSGAAQLAGIF